MADGRGKFHHIDGDVYDGKHYYFNLLQVTGKTTRPADTVSTFMLMAPSTLENGKTISSMVKVMKHGQMVVIFMDSILILRNKEKESIPGLMVTNTWASG